MPYHTFGCAVFQEAFNKGSGECAGVSEESTPSWNERLEAMPGGKCFLLKPYRICGRVNSHSYKEKRRLMIVKVKSTGCLIGAREG